MLSHSPSNRKVSDVFVFDFHTLYQDALFQFVHLNKLSSFNIESILPDLEMNGVIDFVERALIEKQPSHVEKIKVLFKQIMPLKQMKYHRSLIEVLIMRHQLELAHLLASKLDDLTATKKSSFSISPIPEHKLSVKFLNVQDQSDSSKIDSNDSVVPPDPVPAASTSRWVAMKTTDFSNERYLGQGTYAKVFEATFGRTRQKVALKKLLATLNNEDTWKREVEILRQADHQNIVSIMGIVENFEVEEVWIVTELMNNGSLRPYCTGNKQKELTIDQKLDIGIHCWSALTYLHDTAKITHKDIKPENILLHQTPQGDQIAKLCDFGLAEVKTTLTITEETKLGGTYMYYPPEFAESKRNPRKADVYSLGATICELLVNHHFWHTPENGKRMDDFQILFKLVTIFQTLAGGGLETECYAPGAHALEKCPNCPAPVSDILKSTVYFDRRVRPSASEVLAVFQDIKKPASRTNKTSNSARLHKNLHENDDDLIFGFKM